MTSLDPRSVRGGLPACFVHRLLACIVVSGISPCTVIWLYLILNPDRSRRVFNPVGRAFESFNKDAVVAIGVHLPLSRALLMVCVKQNEYELRGPRIPKMRSSQPELSSDICLLLNSRRRASALASPRRGPDANQTALL